MNADKCDLKVQQKKRDPDLINAEIAIKRAAIKARELAKKNGTAVVTLENQVIKKEYPDHKFSPR